MALSLSTNVLFFLTCQKILVDLKNDKGIEGQPEQRVCGCGLYLSRMFRFRASRSWARCQARSLFHMLSEAGLTHLPTPMLAVLSLPRCLRKNSHLLFFSFALAWRLSCTLLHKSTGRKKDVKRDQQAFSKDPLLCPAPQSHLRAPLGLCQAAQQGPSVSPLLWPHQGAARVGAFCTLIYQSAFFPPFLSFNVIVFCVTL